MHLGCAAISLGCAAISLGCAAISLGFRSSPVWFARSGDLVHHRGHEALPDPGRGTGSVAFGHAPADP